VLAGGGIKGLSNAPAIKLMSDAGVLNSVENVIGSSVGGLNASMLALGNNPDEIEHFLRTGGEGLMDLFSASPVFGSTIQRIGKGILNFIQDQGVAKGHALYEIAQSAVKEKLGHPNATFSDLAKRKGEKSETGGLYRNLELTVTVSDARGNYQVVCSPATTPNMPLALAMRMTAGLPPVFPPVKISSEQLKAFTQGATEPLVKYDRGKPFPPFETEKFYALENSDKQEYITKINDDIIKNSAKNDGSIYCTDGGVVDNLPVYLAVNKEDGSIEETIAFDFEEPWRKEKREEHHAMYAKGISIDQDQERRYIKEGLNIAKNDAVYHLYQKYVTGSRVPPSYQLALLQQQNMLYFDIDDITAADFELESDQHMTHKQKISYLLVSGYMAAYRYLRAKGKEVQQRFQSMYPGIVSPPQSHHEQIKAAEEKIKLWETVIATLSKEVDIPDDVDNQIKSLRNFIKAAIKAQKRHEALSQLNAMRLKNIEAFTEENIVEIIQAKKECKIALNEVVQNLTFFDRLHYMLKTKISVYDSVLKRVAPNLAERLEKVTAIRKSSKLLTEMTALIRDESLALTHVKRAAASEYTVRGVVGTLGRLMGGAIKNIYGRIQGLFGIEAKVVDKPVKVQSTNDSDLDGAIEPHRNVFQQTQRFLTDSFQRHNMAASQKKSYCQTQNVSAKKVMEEAQRRMTANLDNIVAIDPFSDKSTQHGCVITFVPNQDKPAVKVYAAEASENKTNFYMDNKDRSINENDEMQVAIQKMCEIAVFAAEPKAQFSISQSHSPEVRNLVNESIRMAIQKALDAEPPKFKQGEEPIIEFKNKPKNRMTL
tara:strand:+ start:39976 stop:42447 length:2472 start_codon:yes stop_codon:yes gene_type:complete